MAKQRRLTAREITDLSRIITHCEELVNARGMHDEQVGVYDVAPFVIMIKSGAEWYGVRVAYHGEVVMWAHWRTPSASGRSYFDRGDWEAELLARPAAHA